MREFIINERFLVNPVLSTIHDTASGMEIRLEPRIMQLLIVLCTNCGRLVSREELINEIWQDYGGGDDGLTQAISFLRKTLDDSSKDVIRTIPKKGYILQGAITQPGHKQSIGASVTTTTKGRRNLRYFLGGIAIVGILVLTVIFFMNNSLPKQTGTEIAFPGNSEEEDNNPLTTATTTDSLGNRYRLVMIGDRRPKFYVNDSLQIDQEPYDALIDKLARELWRRQKETQNE